MRSILLGGAALALMIGPALGADLGGDMQVKAAPLPAFSWTSCYAGGHVAGGWGYKDLTDSAGIVSASSGFASASLDTSGYMLGGQIGCDYQFAPNWVIGIEGAAAGGDIGGGTTVPQPLGIPGDNATFNETTDFLSSATARVGYAWDRWLVYVNGGAAWAGDRYRASGVFLGAPYDFQGLETRFGWTAGAGVEWVFWNGWSVSLEYDYYGFGNHIVTFNDATTGNSGPEDIRQNIQVVKLGLNFRMFSAGQSQW